MKTDQKMIQRVASRKIAEIEREGGALKDFFKGIVYSDYEIAIQNLVEKSVLTVGSLNLIPFRSVPNKIVVSPDEIFVDGRDNKYVVALDEPTPLIGLSLLMGSEELLKKDKNSRMLYKLMKDKGLKVYTTKDLVRKLERQGYKDLIKTANYFNDTPDQKRGKVVHLLTIIRDSGVVRGKSQDFLEDMIEKLTSSSYQGYPPIKILSEAQARYLRSIIFKNESKYISKVPPLVGTTFEAEVRRLLKGTLSPNDIKKRTKAGETVIREEIDRFFKSIQQPYTIDKIHATSRMSKSNSDRGSQSYFVQINGRGKYMAIAVDGMTITKVIRFEEEVDTSPTRWNVDSLLNDPSKHIRL